MEKQIQVWVAYYLDLSDLAVFASELEALRFALDRHMSVKALTLPITREKLLKTPTGRSE